MPGWCVQGLQVTAFLGVREASRCTPLACARTLFPQQQQTFRVWLTNTYSSSPLAHMPPQMMAAW